MDLPEDYKEFGLVNAEDLSRISTCSFNQVLVERFYARLNRKHRRLFLDLPAVFSKADVYCCGDPEQRYTGMFISVCLHQDLIKLREDGLFEKILILPKPKPDSNRPKTICVVIRWRILS